MMKKRQKQEYGELDRRLNTYAINSSNTMQISQVTKNRIWNDLHHELHERNMMKRFHKRRVYRLAFTVSLLVVLLVGIDLSSNASLFRQLLIDIGHDSITFYERGTNLDNSYRSEVMENEIREARLQNEIGYIAPQLLNGYDFVSTNVKGNVLQIELKSKEGSKALKIVEKVIAEESGTRAKYNENIFEVEFIKRNGIEYVILQNEKVNICMFMIDNIEFQITGNVYDDLVAQAYLIGE